MNPMDTPIEDSRIAVTVDNVINHPVGWKKHHRWQWGWQKFLAVVDMIERAWPRNP